MGDTPDWGTDMTNVAIACRHAAHADGRVANIDSESKAGRGGPRRAEGLEDYTQI
jgi:hypothetical protein